MTSKKRKIVVALGAILTVLAFWLAYSILTAVPGPSQQCVAISAEVKSALPPGVSEDRVRQFFAAKGWKATLSTGLDQYDERVLVDSTSLQKHYVIVIVHIKDRKVSYSEVEDFLQYF